ncbi:unnamed protein product [Schistosoma turkestanicum]|nr:unnamed protein product [Schistosoma turkestanicum]
MHLKSTYPDQISPSHQTQSSLTTTMATITHNLHPIIRSPFNYTQSTMVLFTIVSELNTLNFTSGNMMNNNNTSTTSSLLPSSSSTSSSLPMSSTGIQSEPMNHNTLLTNHRSLLTGNNKY